MTTHPPPVLCRCTTCRTGKLPEQPAGAMFARANHRCGRCKHMSAHLDPTLDNPADDRADCATCQLTIKEVSA